MRLKKQILSLSIIFLLTIFCFFQNEDFAIGAATGTCGTSNGGTYSTFPTTGLCATGTSVTDWWDSTYTKRQEIRITGNTVALTNFQIKLTVTYDSDMQADFDDLRFISADGVVLDYFIESKTDSSTASVWVEVNSILTTGTSIYMYYGNSSVSTASNGTNTFLLYDDFSTNTIGTKWAETTVIGATRSDTYTKMGVHTIENGGYHAYQSTAADRAAGLKAYTALSVTSVSQVTMTYTTRAGRTPPYVYFGCGYFQTTSAAYWNYGYWSAAVKGGLNPNSPSDSIVMVWSDGSNTYKAYRNGTLLVSGTLANSTSKKPAFGVRTGTSETINLYFDNFFARKYVATEPTGAFITEEAYNSTNWDWRCYGDTTTVLCSASKGTSLCGTANGGSSIIAPTSNLCASGSVGSPFGNGSDGAMNLSPSTTYNLNTVSYWPGSPATAPGVNFSVTEYTKNDKIIIDSSTAAGLKVGDEVLIINLQGTPTNYANVGLYETVRIGTITTNTPTGKSTLTLTSFLINEYDGKTQKIMVQRVPNWSNLVTGTNSFITSNKWNGTLGGVVIFRVNGTYTKAGSISAIGGGFKGATRTDGRSSCTYPWPTVAGDRGESYTGNNTLAGASRCASVVGHRIAVTSIGGGGGGGAGSTSSGRGGGGGGGAGHSSAGAAGAQTSYAEAGGPGGSSYGESSLLSRIYLGSGGGQSGTSVNLGNTNGGDGGGIIMIYANKIISTAGYLYANGIGGTSGTSSTSDDCSGAGGGGSGGSILIVGNALTLGSASYSALGSGGLGATNVWAGTCGAGGAGSTGRIAFHYYNSLSGSSNPSATTSQKTYSFPSAGPWSWSCSDASSSSSCSATQATPVCGTANGGSYSAIPTDLCETGASAVDPSWAAFDFTARKPITITNSASTLTNYAVLMNISYATEMQADFDDIRFYDGSKNELSYWIESKTDSSTARVWVKIPSLPAGATTVYMYYGNSTTGSKSNGDNVFTFFDDFELASLNTTKWTEYDSGNYINQTGGVLTVNGGSNTDYTDGMFTNTTFTRGDFVIEGKYINDATSTDEYRDATNMWMKNTTTTLTFASFTNGIEFYIEPDGSYHWGTNESGTDLELGGDLTINTQYKIRQIVKAAGGAITQVSSDNGATWTTATDSSYYSGNFKVGFTHFSGGKISIDDIIVRPYTSSEPTVATGTVESLSYSLPDEGPWSWVCSAGGLSSSACSATYVAPDCGSANGTSIPSAPTENLCDAYGSAARADWWDHSFTKRKSVSIANSSGSTLTDYQVPVTLNYSDFSSAQTDFDDIRFTGSDKVTPLSYWIESKTDGSTAKIWVKIPSIPTEGTTIYVYYGKSTVTTTSSGNDTFVFFDDFNSFDSSKWTSTSLSGSRTFSSSIMTDSITGNDKHNAITAITDTNNSTVISGIKFRVTTCSANNCGSRFGIKSSGMTVGADLSLEKDASSVVHIAPLNENIAWGTNLQSASLSTWYIFEIRHNYSSTFYYRVGQSSSWNSWAINPSGTHLIIHSLTYSTGTIIADYDWVYQRKYATTEPVATVSETEELNTTLGFSTSGPWSWVCITSSGVPGENTCSATRSATLTATDLKAPLELNSLNNLWYCNTYFDGSDNYQTGNNGSLDFQFVYGDVEGKTLRNYRFAFSTGSDPDATGATRIPVDNSIDASLEWTNIPSPYVAVDETVDVEDRTSVKKNASSSLGQIAFGNTYNWWVKLKNSSGTDSGWIAGTSFSTISRSAPIIKFLPSSYIVRNKKVRYCSTADTSNTSDPCYPVCWRGASAPTTSADIEGTNWKCSICYNSSNEATPCSTSSGNTFEWTLPSSGVSFATGSTAATANPELIFTEDQPLKLKIADGTTGVTCGLQRSETSYTSSIAAKAKWIEK